MNLKKVLAQDLPGRKAQENMLAQPRKAITMPNSVSDATPASVLILLYQLKDDIWFFLTERTHTVDTHKGQISFPGGVKEINESLEDTARRETWEEIGIPADDINIIGELTPLFVPVTGFLIHPFVGWIDFIPEIKAEPSEVASIFSVPLTQLVSDDREKRELWNLRGHDVDVPFFKFSGHKVWGATAMILSEFKQVQLEAGNLD